MWCGCITGEEGYRVLAVSGVTEGTTGGRHPLAPLVHLCRSPLGTQRRLRRPGSNCPCALERPVTCRTGGHESCGLVGSVRGGNKNCKLPTWETSIVSWWTVMLKYLLR